MKTFVLVLAVFLFLACGLVSVLPATGTAHAASAVWSECCLEGSIGCCLMAYAEWLFDHWL